MSLSYLCPIRHSCKLFNYVVNLSLYSENAGLLALTRVGSRRVVQISAGFMLFFSVLGKLIILCFRPAYKATF